MIPIPKVLVDKLAPHAQLDGAVRLSLGRFDEWLADRNLYFFPEYTDHGPKHVAEVIETAVELTTANAPITATDAAVLLIACVLHDCAMHLTPDGFRTLLRADGGYVRIPGFQDAPWAELWQDFLVEARRFDERRLRRLFGDTDPIREPDLDGTLNDRDRYLVGEFLRRHHPRLAHEIAHYGVPGPEPERLRLEGLDGDLADLAGLVARSHGMSLRACLPYLSHRYHRREFNGVHAVYLMTLLRVADYLQIRAERAPRGLLTVRRLRSPISRIEWQVHHSIRNITTAEDDPEAILIQANPTDLVTFLRLRQWLDGIQSELDGSWAVLGELYGRHEELGRLGLRVRRVHSNLDDLDKFERDAGFVPVPATFSVASARLLHLLVGPLYGETPAFGARELLQNAVDAVRELEYTQEKFPKLRGVARVAQEADVVIRLEDESLTVSDRGIGMTAEILRNYFLKAGASFRSSDAWKQRFEDEEGTSHVLRSGRFGVGALAAFLLGDRIEVTTRHLEVDENEGITFTASLDDDPIEMRKTKCAVGTTIRVRLQPGIAALLAREPDSWDWYTLDKPSVVRSYRDRRFEQQYRLPGEGAPLPRKWHRIVDPYYTDIQWTYERAPGVASNGIGVVVEPRSQPKSTAIYDFDDHYVAFHTVQLARPNVCVFDPTGRLPLNLQRTRIGGNRFPFHDSLYKACVRRFLAATLVQGPTRDFAKGATFDLVPHPYWIGYWYTTDKGICVRDASLMHQAGWEAYLLIPGVGEIDFGDACLAPARIPQFDGGVPRSIEWPVPPEFASRGRVLVQDSLSIEVSEQKGYIAESKDRGWTLYRRGECPPAVTDFPTAADRLIRANAFRWTGLLFELYPPEGFAPAPSVLSTIWNDVIGTPAIPFSMELRRSRLAHAFEALHEYIDDFD